jgi:uncharacterized protein (TIGR02266 family)
MGDQQGRAGRNGQHDGANDKERRASVRQPVEMWVEELMEGSQVFRRAGNLSRGGMYLDQTIPIPVGTRVRLRFTLPGDDVPLVVMGEIVSISASAALGMGVKFVTVPDEAQSRIDLYLAAHSG